MYVLLEATGNVSMPFCLKDGTKKTVTFIPGKKPDPQKTLGGRRKTGR